MIKSSKYESAETGKKQKEVKKPAASGKENSCPEPAEDQMDEETLRSVTSPTVLR
jgi:hypothetical protein